MTQYKKNRRKKRERDAKKQMCPAISGKTITGQRSGRFSPKGVDSKMHLLKEEKNKLKTGSKGRETQG